jgi:hypothetical protein
MNITVMLDEIPSRCNVYIDVSENPAASLFRVEVSATQEAERYRCMKIRTETGATAEPVGGDSPKKGQIFLKENGREKS